jgi:hypothetical protein
VDVTTIAVWKNPNINQYLIGMRSGYVAYYIQTAPAANTLQHRARDASNQMITVDTVATSGAGFRYCTAWLDGPNAKLRQDGVQTTGANVNYADTTFPAGTIGQYGAGGYLTGDIGEIVIYGVALSAADITQVETYLKTKWGL